MANNNNVQLPNSLHNTIALLRNAQMAGENEAQISKETNEFF